MIQKHHKTMFGETGASFSECEQYRYSLWRVWDAGPLVNYIMLNPSTADELANDPTIERCQRRAQQLGFGGLIVTNLFAYRATDPRDMKRCIDPIGAGNDDAIRESASESELIICGWGNHGTYLRRSAAVRQMLLDFCPWKLAYLKLGKTGEPCHPLYLPYELQPQKFVLESEASND